MNWWILPTAVKGPFDFKAFEQEKQRLGLPAFQLRRAWNLQSKDLCDGNCNYREISSCHMAKGELATSGGGMAEPIPNDTFHFEHRGYCELCEKEVTFSADGPYFRSTLRCPSCRSAPRNRALFNSLTRFFPNWRNLAIHESSPGWDRLSVRLRSECAAYTATQWDPSIPFGSIDPMKGYRSEDLQAQTFSDAMFDIVITQDVFEHIFRPDLAIKEIARTLKDGGAFLCTVPIVRKTRPSARRASLVEGDIVHHMEPQYHGNPVSKDGSLVTIDWGYDIVSYLQHHSSLNFLMLNVDNIDLGIRADLNEVLIGFKRRIPEL